MLPISARRCQLALAALYFGSPEGEQNQLHDESLGQAGREKGGAGLVKNPAGSRRGHGELGYREEPDSFCFHDIDPAKYHGCQG